MVSEVDYVALFTWIKSIDKLWTNEFQTVYIYVDDRLLGDVHQRPDFWPFFNPWIKARCAHLGPYREHTTAIHVPIGACTGLNRVHFTWAGTFVLKAFVYLFPNKNFVLIDTDCVPTSLFEVEELARLMLARKDKTKDFGPCLINSQADPSCPIVMLCSESKAEINAGMIIVISCRSLPPHANSMATGLMASRRQYVNNKCPEPNYDDIAMSGLLWTPLLATQAAVPLHWTHAWALLGEWSGHICFPLPAASDGAKYHWPRHGTILGEKYRQRRPALVFFSLRLPNGQYGPVSQLSRSEKCCTGPFNWGEAHCAGENVKRRTGPFLRKSLMNQTRTTTRQRGAARHGNQEPPGQAPRCTGRKQQPKHTGDFTDRSRYALTYIEMPWTML